MKEKWDGAFINYDVMLNHHHSRELALQVDSWAIRYAFVMKSSP